MATRGVALTEDQSEAEAAEPELRESPRARFRRLLSDLRHQQLLVRLDLAIVQGRIARCRRLGAELRAVRRQVKGPLYPWPKKARDEKTPTQPV